MEESGELGRKPVGSQPPENLSSGAPTSNKPSKIREEGELTSSDEDALPTSSAGTSFTATSLYSKANAVSDIDSQNVKSGVPVSANYQTRSVLSRVSIQPIAQKGYNLKSKVPIKSSNSGWQVSHATDSNLIISFSDDDSGSESEPQGPEKAPDSICNYHVANTRKKHAPLLAAGLESAQRTTRNDGKVLSKKVLINQAPASSVPRFTGPKPRNLRSLSVEPRFFSTNSSSVGKNLASQDHGHSKGGDLNDGKLQDLRQQIAMRENELKLKTVQFVQQNKENLSKSPREFSDLNHNSVASRRSRLSSSDSHSELKEPDAKRVRLNDSTLGQSSSFGHNKSIVPSKELGLKSNNPHGGSIVKHRQGREIADSEVHPTSSGVQLQGKQCPPSATLKSGIHECFTGSFSLSDWMSKSRSSLAMLKPATLSASVSLGKLQNPSDADRLDANDPSGNALNQAVSKDDVSKNRVRQDAVCGHDKFKSDSNLQVHSVQATPSGGSPLNGQDEVSHPGCDVTLLSLIKAEEYHDKQLEEAQEHRRKCEIEERNALKAYREAQRELAEANAQCSYFYRLRELFSAHARSFMMEDSSLFLSSKQQEQFDHRWNFLNNVSRADVDPYPTLHAEINAGNQVCYGSSVQSAEVDAQNRTSPNVAGHNLGSEPCGEPDASTSEILLHKDKEAVNALSPSNDPNVSSDEYDGIEFQRNNGLQRKSETVIGYPAPNLSINNFQESMHREAQLRLELFKKLPMFTSSRRSGIGGSNINRIDKVAEFDVVSGKAKMIVEKSPSPNSTNERFVDFVSSEGDLMDLAYERAQDHDITAKTQFLMENVLHSNQEKNQVSDLGGSETYKGSINKFQQVEQSFMNYSPDKTANLVDCSLQSTSGSLYLLAASTFRSAFYQMKGVCPVIYNHVRKSNQHDCTSCGFNDEKSIFNEVTVRDQLIGGLDPYTCNSVIDPFWPLCMYELRGKCNDEECPWQHARDYSRGNLQQQIGSIHAGSQAGLTSICQNQTGGTNLSRISTPPAYLVCFNSLKLDSHSCDTLFDQKYRSCCTKIYSVCLAVSSSLQKHVSSVDPILHGNYYGCIETRSPYRQSLYVQDRSDSMNLLQTCPADSDKIIETSLTIVCRDGNNFEGVRKSLSMLTQALEVDPTYSHLWVVYLVVYYSNMDTVGDEDLFSCAVKHNEGSYELWLMYINSFRLLKDQFAAYDRAISTMCHKLPAGEVYNCSAFILDLFLQMLHCYCISGNVEKAIKRIYGLVNNGKYSDSLLLSDILKCLTISDETVFWVCCVYLIVYRKLPDAVVLSFEFQKDISLIDWPCVQITKEEKELACKLIDMALNYSKAHVDCAFPDDRAALEPAQHFALCHVKLVRVLDGLESCKKLLEKYTNQYPSCVELVLLSARVSSEKDEGQKGISVFEEAVRNWPKDVPGIQCIWNQYVEYALQTDGYDAAKNVLVRWLDSVSTVPSSQNGFANDNGGVERNGVIDPSSDLCVNASGSEPANIDLVFGQLNLSLYMLTQNNVVKAHLAIDKALKSGQGEYLRYCIREHAIFLLNYGTQLGKDVSINKILSVLNSYIVSIDLPFRESLSRKFIWQIQKPRVRQLLEGIFCPLSPDFSILNLILETWFGPSLLPQNFEKTKELVDLVESVLDISPANYPLAISACKLLMQEANAAGTSISFWASSTLVNTIYQSVPVPPEYVWVEASGLLGMLKGTDEAVCESFYRKALSVYPFSVELWRLYLCSSSSDDGRRSVVEAARAKGVEL